MYFCMKISGYGRKFYAVAKGRIPGIYTDWGSCFLQVHDSKETYSRVFSPEMRPKCLFSLTTKIICAIET